MTACFFSDSVGYDLAMTPDVEFGIVQPDSPQKTCRSLCNRIHPCAGELLIVDLYYFKSTNPFHPSDKSMLSMGAELPQASPLHPTTPES